ncbi:MAG: hypothetical protein JWM05_420, partial [Acidimicrobiales bacterium]|nr:hypothetical protein [Acidimicrobiales bacterium]
MFVPGTIVLEEVGPAQPYEWQMTTALTWVGTFRGAPRQLRVPGSSAAPFATDLASVPRSLTWLFPRYGKYTKAAVVHDYACRNFGSQPPDPPAGGEPPSMLPLRDRSDADEVFYLLMKELRVPWLRRRLMWGAVSWATLMTSLVPGRGSAPANRWIGRFIAAAGVVASLANLAGHRDRLALVVVVIGVLGAVLVGGTIALKRPDRIVPYLGMGALTLLASPLLVIGAALGLVVYGYTFLEDLL